MSSTSPNTFANRPVPAGKDQFEKTKPADLSSTRACGFFFAAAILFAIIETFLPVLCRWNYRGDILEQIIIGREWVISSFSHPALTTWLMQIFQVLFHRAVFAPYLLSALCVLASTAAVWRLARYFLSERFSLLAAFSLGSLWYFTGQCYMYNNNMTLIVFWSLSIYTFYKAISTNRSIFWILTGLVLACALLSKLSALSLALTFPLYLATNKKGRTFWKTPGPYLTFLTALTAFSPFLRFYWQYHREINSHTCWLNCSWSEFPKEFFRKWIEQLLIALPLLICIFPVLELTKSLLREKICKRNICGFLLGSREFKNEYDDFLAKMFLFPILIQTAIQCYLRVPLASHGYGLPLWLIFPLTMLYYFPAKKVTSKEWLQSKILTLGFISALLSTIPIYTVLTCNFSSQPSLRLFSGRKLTESVESLWDQRFSVPIPYVAGDSSRFSWIVSALGRDEPTIVIPDIGNWKSDGNVCAEGGVILWDESLENHGTIPKFLSKRFPNAQLADILQIPYRQKKLKDKPARIGVAFVPPPTVPRDQPVTCSRKNGQLKPRHQ